MFVLKITVTIVTVHKLFYVLKYTCNTCNFSSKLTSSIVIRKRHSLETAVSQLIIFFNAIYSSSQASVPAQRKKINTQRERLYNKNRDKKFYKLLYLQKGCISLEIFHFNLDFMSGENCAFAGCSSNRRHKDISLFKLPTAKNETMDEWRREMLNIITKDRVVDANFKKQVDNEHVYVCEKHFRECDMYICKYNSG